MAIFVLSGRVAALLPGGFKMAAEDGGETMVVTMEDGQKLGLKPGDMVDVYGGPPPQGGGIFLCSAIHLVGRDGKAVRLDTK